MAKQVKLSASEVDGVQYRRAKMWQVLCYACNALIGMSVYQLIGMASYSASLGFGISTMAVGYILTGTRILDAVTDPLLAFIYDKVNTKWGKIRILLLCGWVIEAIGLFAMFWWAPGHYDGALGFVMFLALYVIYIIGYTMVNITAQTIPALISNDPRQRPTIGVYNTVLNYLTPMILSIVFNVVLLPKFGGTYTLGFLATAARITVTVSFVGVVMVCLGVAEYDIPENFKGLTVKRESLKMRDMFAVLKDNKPLQCFIISESSDKIAQQTASQAIVTTMLYGILIGNMGMSTILSMVAMLPSILFAAFGAKWAGKYGSKEAIRTWTKICMVSGVIAIAFFVLGDTTKIAAFGPMMIGYVLITLFQNGAKMCVTTANVSFMSDIIDYELDRSGNFVPAVVTGTYSFIDKIVSSFSGLIATGAVALIGYTATMPQPGDALTTQVKAVTILLYYGFPMLGWICTLIAMKFCKLDKQEMIEVQKRIQRKKEVAVEEIAQENLQ